MHRTYSFERLDAWQEARKLVKLIYTASEPFPTQELYGIKSQIRRAAVSVSSNIAEGSGRTSSVEQRQFYRMAYSSLMEVLSQIILCNDLDYISIEQLCTTRTQIDQTSKFLLGLIKSKGKII